VGGLAGVVAAGVSVTGHRAVDTGPQRRRSIRDRTGSYRGETLWTFAGNGSFRSSPTVVDGTVYAGTTNRLLYAIDAEGGTKVAVEATTGSVRTTPAVVDSTIYVGDDTTVYALVEFG